MHLQTAAQLLAISPFLVHAVLANPAPPQVQVDINEIHMIPPGGIVGDEEPRMAADRNRRNHRGRSGTRDFIHDLFGSDYICYMRTKHQDDARDCCEDIEGRVTRKGNCVVRDVIFNPQSGWKSCALEKDGFKYAECVRQDRMNDDDEEEQRRRRNRNGRSREEEEEEERRRRRNGRDYDDDDDDEEERRRRGRHSDDDEDDEERRRRHRDGRRYDDDEDEDESRRRRNGDRNGGRRGDRDNENDDDYEDESNRNRDRRHRSRSGRRDRYEDEERSSDRYRRGHRNRKNQHRMHDNEQDDLNNRQRLECKLESDNKEQDTQRCCNRAQGFINRNGQECNVSRRNEDEFLECARTTPGVQRERCRRE